MDTRSGLAPGSRQRSRSLCTFWGLNGNCVKWKLALGVGNWWRRPIKVLSGPSFQGLLINCEVLMQNEARLDEVGRGRRISLNIRDGHAPSRSWLGQTFETTLT